MQSTEAFVSRLVQDVPALQPTYQEHMAENREILPHMLMGDITRFVQDLHAQALSGNADANESLDRLLDMLERGMKSSDESVKELIGASFLENLDRDRPHFLDLRSRLGDALLRQLELWQEYLG